MPPGSAKASNRAAMFTPSPKMSCSSTITSPRLMPCGTRSASLARFRQCARPCRAASRPRTGQHRPRSQTPPRNRRGVLYDPTPVLGDLRIDQFAEVSLEPFVGAFLVRPHQPGIAGDIGGQDCSEMTYSRHGSPGGKVRLTKSTLKPAAALALISAYRSYLGARSADRAGSGLAPIRSERGRTRPASRRESLPQAASTTASIPSKALGPASPSATHGTL